MANQDGYKIRNKEGIYFITFAVTGWVDLFTRKKYRDIMIDSLRFCQKKKGLQIYAWCLMSNHIHCIAKGLQGNLSDILRDFKTYTSIKLSTAIRTHPGEYRRDWIMRVFAEAGMQHRKNIHFQLWRHDNQPVELITEAFMRQKLNYIHRNPVAAGIVDKEEEYVLSSARDYYYGRKCGLLEIEFLF